MSRTASRQFSWYSREEAAAYLASAVKMHENHGDRIAMERRLMPVTTAEERAASRAYNLQAARERLARALRG